MGLVVEGVLLRLLASANRAVPIDTLTDDVWEGEPPLAAASTLQSHVSALRHLLGPERLEFSEGGYRVSLQPGELDVSQFDGDASGVGAKSPTERRLPASRCLRILDSRRSRSSEVRRPAAVNRSGQRT